MGIPIPLTKGNIEKISDKMRHGEELFEDEEVLFSAFRVKHYTILHHYDSIIRQKISTDKYLHKGILSAQRLKKRKTIANKLSSRFSTMCLSRMHDIAGCRVIFPSLDLLNKFRNELLGSQKRSKKYHLVSNDKYDYISKPNEKTGYRGIHDVFREIDGKGIRTQVEIQFRTKVQHAWATACEIWDDRFSDKTKFGVSEKSTQLFFKLLSEFFARFKEKKSFIPMTDIKLYKTILQMEYRYKILYNLKKIHIIDDIGSKVPQKKQKEAYLILSKDIEHTSVSTYQKISEAIDQYSQKERSDPDKNTVLIRSSPYYRKTFNNYFMDTTEFFKIWYECRALCCQGQKMKCFLLEFFYKLDKNLRNNTLKK